MAQDSSKAKQKVCSEKIIILTLAYEKNFSKDLRWTVYSIPVRNSIP